MHFHFQGKYFLTLSITPVVNIFDRLIIEGVPPEILKISENGADITYKQNNWCQLFPYTGLF